LLDSYSYTYDANGNRTDVTSATGTDYNSLLVFGSGTMLFTDTAVNQDIGL